MHINFLKSNKQSIYSAHVVVQPIPSIGTVNDPLEKEADNFADKIMRMPK